MFIYSSESAKSLSPEITALIVRHDTDSPGIVYIDIL